MRLPLSLFMTLGKWFQQFRTGCCLRYLIKMTIATIDQTEVPRGLIYWLMFVFHSAAPRWRVQNAKRPLITETSALSNSSLQSVHCFGTDDVSKNGRFHPVPFQPINCFLLLYGLRALCRTYFPSCLRAGNFSSVRRAVTQRLALPSPFSLILYAKGPLEVWFSFDA